MLLYDIVAVDNCHFSYFLCSIINVIAERSEPMTLIMSTSSLIHTYRNKNDNVICRFYFDVHGAYRFNFLLNKERCYE
ncbi:hypothetical protein ACN08N_00215 (plasmid) [Photobacterium leiognathi subsp. mandapamensis]|uniref:hypothetical protein n=1 Tax=Photobacterium leiognathi TaxID=553611 RepID=UPI003AF3330E